MNDPIIPEVKRAILLVIDDGLNRDAIEVEDKVADIFRKFGQVVNGRMYMLAMDELIKELRLTMTWSGEGCTVRKATTPEKPSEQPQLLFSHQATATCCICGSHDELKLIPRIASSNAVGRKWCLACFRIWYDDGVTDTEEILRRRKNVTSEDSKK